MNHPFFEISKKVEESALNQLLMLPRILLLHARFFVCVVGGKSHDARHSNFPPTTLFQFLVLFGFGGKEGVSPILPLLSHFSFPSFLSRLFPIFFFFFASYSCLRRSFLYMICGMENKNKVNHRKNAKKRPKPSKTILKEHLFIQKQQQEGKRNQKHFLTFETRKKNSFLFPPPLIVVVVSPLLSWLVFSYAPSFLPQQNGKREGKGL